MRGTAKTVRLFLLFLVLAASALALGACTTTGGRGATTGAPESQTVAPFGAAAFDPDTRAWSLVSDEPDLTRARAAALERCEGDGCTIAGVFARGTCASLSLDADRASSHAHLGVARERDTAQALARVACRLDGGTDCKASQPVCN
jgi:hypothetical protein